MIEAKLRARLAAWDALQRQRELTEAERRQRASDRIALMLATL